MSDKAKPDKLLYEVQHAKAEQLAEIAKRGNREAELCRAEAQRRIDKFTKKILGVIAIDA